MNLGLAAPLITSGGFLARSQNSHAALPLLATFILGGFARRTAARTVANSALRSNTARALGNGGGASSSAQAAQNNTWNFVSQGLITRLAVSAGLPVSVSPKVHVKAIRYNAQAIWVSSDLTNYFDLNFRNTSDQLINGELALFLRNVETNKITDKIYAGPLTALPSSDFTFSFQLDELPYTGVINLIAASTMPHLAAEESGNIVVAGADDVLFETV